MKVPKALFIPSLLSVSAAIVWLTNSLLHDWRQYVYPDPGQPGSPGMAAAIAIALCLAGVFLLRLWHIALKTVIQGRQSSAGGRSLPPLPAGYIREFAPQYGIGFCYPEQWVMTRYASGTLYAEFQEPAVASGCRGLRNFNVACQFIDGIRRVQILFDEIVRGGTSVLKEAVVVERVAVRQGPWQGIRYRLRYRLASQRDMCCYQWALTTRRHRILVILTFTLFDDDVAASRGLMHTIVRSIFEREPGTGGTFPPAEGPI